MAGQFSLDHVTKNSQTDRLKDMKGWGGGGEIILFLCKSRHLSIIPLKVFYLIKITELVINFYLKKISDSIILNR